MDIFIVVSFLFWKWSLVRPADYLQKVAIYKTYIYLFSGLAFLREHIFGHTFPDRFIALYDNFHVWDFSVVASFFIWGFRPLDDMTFCMFGKSVHFCIWALWHILLKSCKQRMMDFSYLYKKYFKDNSTSSLLTWSLARSFSVYQKNFYFCSMY